MEKTINNKKFSMTNDKRYFQGFLLSQIVAEEDIPKYGVKKGDVGGWIESESNLSQQGTAWVRGGSYVYGHSRVAGDVLVEGNSRIGNESELQGRGVVRDSTLHFTMTNGEFSFISSTLFNVCLPNKAEVIHSTLKNIETREQTKGFFCRASHLEFLSEGELLKGKYHFFKTTLRAGHSMFSGDIRFEHVDIGIDNREFHAKDTSLLHVVATERSGVNLEYVGLAGNSEDGQIELDGESIVIENSILSGHIRLTGDMDICRTKMNGFISVLVHPSNHLELTDMVLSDFVRAELKANKRAVLSNQTMSGDMVYLN
ncbi:hypothetical protein JMA_38580 (plasmid) [Jeotgalibacillus malaysiensis]|uniref:Uncharacterized protein n=1 Tax=Jeotgalibacillus malaysiensis TaxID=1508404 RepID=A0A0B5ASS8_9BACL|nr:hypothetical protein [Jeotgalibacillus malaysiensis]AJD93176.1 hypothetical protein JMA_38580 [Jeotgalibacillus malaysiensis]